MNSSSSVDVFVESNSKNGDYTSLWEYLSSLEGFNT